MSTQEPSASAGRRRGNTTTPAVVASSASATEPQSAPHPSRSTPKPAMTRTLSSIYFGSIRGTGVKPQRAKMDVNSLFGEQAPAAPTEPTPATKTKSSKKSEPKETTEPSTTESTPPPTENAPIEEPISSSLTLFGKDGDTSVVAFNLGTLQEAASTQQVDLMLNLPRLPPLTKIAQIFQIAGFSDQEVWEGAPEVFAVINHFQSEIRSSERFPDTPIRVVMPQTKEFEGVECRDYQVDKSWPISKVLRIILKKFNISSADAANYLLVSIRNHPLDPELTLADYGLGSLFRSWQMKLITKAEIEAVQEKAKNEAAEAKKAAGLKRLKTAAESHDASSKTPSSSKTKATKKSSKSSKSSKDKEKEKEKKSSSKSSHASSSTTTTSSSSNNDSLSALAASASQVSLDISVGSGEASTDNPKLPSLDLKSLSDTKGDKLSPREPRRTKSSTGGSMRVKSPRGTSSATLAVPGSDGTSGDLTGSSEGSDSVDKANETTEDSTATTSSSQAQDSKEEKQSAKHSRTSSHATLSKKVSINSMTVAVDSPKEGSESSEKASTEKEKEKPERPKKKKTSGETGTSKMLRPKKSTKTSTSTSAAAMATEAAISSALMPTLLLDSLSLRPKTKSVPILLLLQQPDQFRGERVKAVKWSTNMNCKKLISAFCERQGQLANSGHYVLCDLYGRALHPLATLESYGLDAKLNKWELILVHRPDTREVSQLESLPLASTYAWIKNKDVLPRLNMHDAKQIILELDEKLTMLQSRDIVSQYEAKSAEVESLKREVGLLKETERAFTQMFGDAAKVTSADGKPGKVSVDSLTEEWKNSKKVASEAMKAFEAAQSENSHLMKEIEAVRASRQAEIAKLSSAHAAEIAQLSEYSDALFAKNTELVSEMESLHIDAFDQRQRSKQTEREKESAMAGAEELQTQMQVLKETKDSEIEALKKQIESLTSQLTQARTPRPPIVLVEEKPRQEAVTPVPSEEVETEVETTYSAQTVALQDDSEKPTSEEQTHDEDTSSHPGDEDVDAQDETVEEDLAEPLSPAVQPPVAAVAPPPPPPPPPPPMPTPTVVVSDGEGVETSVVGFKLKAIEIPSSSAPDESFGASLQDQIDQLRSKLKAAPPREAPKPSQRNQVMKEIQQFSKDGLKKAPPIEKHVQEPEGLAKALYKRFVAMTDLMDVETLDDDEEDDWDAPSSSVASQRSLSSSAIIDDDGLDSDSDSDSDLDEGDEDDMSSETSSLQHSRSSSRLGIDDDDEEEDSYSDEE